MDYCLNHQLNIAMVNLGVNSTPPQYGKLLNVLLSKVDLPEDVPFDKFSLEMNEVHLRDIMMHELDVKDITLWLFYYFLQKNMFGRIISQQHFEEYLETFYIVFMNTTKAPKICYFNFINFGVLIIEFFKKENFELLKQRYHFQTEQDIE